MMRVKSHDHSRDVCQHTHPELTGKCMPCKFPRTHRRNGLGGESPFKILRVLFATKGTEADFRAGKIRFTVLGAR